MSSGGNRGRGGNGRGRARVKRQQVQSEDGWTVITHGLSKVSLDPKNKKEVAGALPSKIVKDITPQKLLSEFGKLQERWKDTAVATQFQDLVKDKKWTVSEAVCIGIGSFSRDWEHRWRSMWQLVLFMDVILHLDKEVRMYAQDPAFTSIDMEFLRLLSITVVDTGIESHISPRSFVFSPFVDWYVLLPTFLKDKDPVLYVGNEILDDYGVYAQTEDKKEKLGVCNELGKRFLEGRESVKVREFEGHAHALNGMSVYWKPSIDLEKAVEETSV